MKDSPWCACTTTLPCYREVGIPQRLYQDCVKASLVSRPLHSLLPISFLQDESTGGLTARKRSSPLEGKPAASRPTLKKTPAAKTVGKKAVKEQVVVEDVEWWDAAELGKVGFP